MCGVACNSETDTSVRGLSGEANQSGSEKNECFKPNVEFVVVGRKITKLLEAGKESFNEISIFFEMPLIDSDDLSIGFQWIHGSSVHGLDPAKEARGIRGVVHHDSSEILHAIDEIGRFGNVVPFATSQAESHQITPFGYLRLNLGAQATTRTATTLLPVFLGGGSMLEPPNNRAVEKHFFKVRISTKLGKECTPGAFLPSERGA